MEDLLIRKSFLSIPHQAQLVSLLNNIVPGAYVPTTRWGKSMNLRMNSLGHHWSAKTYKYHPTRVDVDNLPCAPIPADLQAIARRALSATQYLEQGDIRPYDICIVNFYTEETGKLGDHVDNSESAESLRSGYPVVSLSLGASCLFRFGGLHRTDPYQQFQLDSGDLIIFGRSKRLAFHGVKKLIPNSTPPNLGIEGNGRINLTFRLL